MEMKEKWALTIEKVDNGFLLTAAEGTEVIQEPEGVEEWQSNLKLGTELCHRVLDYFGLNGDKYDEKRISITTRTGEKYEKPVG
jgi:hypothetical protein